MSFSSRRTFAASAAAALLAVALPAAVRAQATTAPRNRALFQVTDNDPARWNMILNNMTNLREGVGSEGADIELVAYGPGILMLKADSPAKQRIAEALKSGVQVNACQHTMHGMQLAPQDMLPEIGYVPSGVVEVMKKQQQGWAYIRS
jgi:intracellular sulfur oxidation DsrE/DsrF family protein